MPRPERWFEKPQILLMEHQAVEIIPRVWTRGIKRVPPGIGYARGGLEHNAQAPQPGGSGPVLGAEPDAGGLFALPSFSKAPVGFARILATCRVTSNHLARGGVGQSTDQRQSDGAGSFFLRQRPRNRAKT